jgi:hypothetical protein
MRASLAMKMITELFALARGTHGNKALIQSLLAHTGPQRTCTAHPANLATATPSIQKPTNKHA